MPVTVPFTTLPSKASFSPPRLSLRSAAKSSRVGNVVVAIRYIVSLNSNRACRGRATMARPSHADLVQMHCRAGSCRTRRPFERWPLQPRHDKKRVPVPVTIRSTVRARQRTGCREWEVQRPPDGARLSLEGKRGQAPRWCLPSLDNEPRSGRRLSRAQAPAGAAEAEAAAPGRCPSPGSPSRPGTSASPEAAAEAAGAAAEAAAAAAATRSYRSVRPEAHRPIAGMEIVCRNGPQVVRQNGPKSRFLVSK